MANSLLVTVDVHECPRCRSVDVVSIRRVDEQLALAWGTCDQCGPVSLVPKGFAC